MGIGELMRDPERPETAATMIEAFANVIPADRIRAHSLSQARVGIIETAINEPRRGTRNNSLAEPVQRRASKSRTPEFCALAPQSQGQ
jgi:hypothetical protein